jgi:methyl-accepting chemotaxis protein
LIAVNIVAIGFAELQISKLAKSSQELASYTRQNDGFIKELEVLTKGIELDILASQEALTDISATRGMDGLDDGFTRADEAAAALAEKTKRVSELGDRLGEPELGAAAVSLGERFTVFRAAGVEMAKAYVAGGPAEGNKLMASFDQVADNLQQEVEVAMAAIHAAEAEIDAQIESQMAAKLAEAEKSLYIGLGFAGLALALGLILMMYIVRNVIRPLVGMKDYMGMLATGDYSNEVPYAQRKDEIGEMAQSVAYFRQGEVERKDARAKSAAEQAEIKRLEEEAAERQAAEDAERVRVIEALTTGLENLSSGNLAYRINATFAPAYEKLRTEFNSAVGSLGETIDEISSTTEAVRLASSEIGSASDDLSKRTEQQAASLEETAAALDEITSTVKSSSQRAEEASDMVGTAKAGAEKSGAVVKNAISAMERIEESSKQISQIISVIDDIAFQTNLLALNAGVEAARAGEAGKGFAVVAQEVRELAGRSANAAKEIKTLIETSSTQVGTGVTLVNQTGTALGEIEGQVSKINDLIQSIVTGAREQSTALAEINSAVNQMDQTTQQNAAMVEETNAATQGLSGEAVKLEGLVRRFNTGGRATHAAPAAANASSKPAQSPARALGAKIASAFGRGGAATAQKEESWSEF